MKKTYRLIAPDIDSLLRFFRDGHMNACSPTPAVIAAIDPLFEALHALAPSEQNDEYKSIWLQIARAGGTVQPGLGVNRIDMIFSYILPPETFAPIWMA